MTDDAIDIRVWRVLVAAPFPPRLDGHHGGSRAIGQFLRQLATRHSVALLALRSEGEVGVDPVLRSACELVDEIEIPPVGTSVRARIENKLRVRAALLGGTPTWAAERTAPGFAERLAEVAQRWCPDVVQLEYRIMGQFLPAVAGVAPCILEDYDPIRVQRVDSRFLASLEERAWRTLGRAAARDADCLVALTERDRQTLSQVSGSTPVVTIPLGYELPDPPLDPVGADPPRVLCVGSFIHPPNVDSAIWLAREIFPLVEERLPNAVLELIGSDAPEEVLALERAGVEVKVDVPDVRPYLETAALAVAPIRLGGGMRVKVLEALANGKAVVATPLALEGLEVTHGEHVLVADTTQGFADAIVRLLRDPTRRAAVGTAARLWAEAHVAIESRVQAHELLYASLVEGRVRV